MITILISLQYEPSQKQSLSKPHGLRKTSPLYLVDQPPFEPRGSVLES
jgi:hypothetical protein